MMSMTSPGMKRTDRNTNTLKMNRVGMTSSSSRMMRLSCRSHRDPVPPTLGWVRGTNRLVESRSDSYFTRPKGD